MGGRTERERDLEARVAHLEALVERLTGQGSRGEEPPPDPSSTSGTDGPAAAPSYEATSDPALYDRRHLLSRAGTAAVGAVLGGAAAAVATASPAAAATGTFDSTDATPALTATNTGTGNAIEAAASTGNALKTTGSTDLNGPLSVHGSTTLTGSADINAVGQSRGLSVTGQTPLPGGGNTTGIFCRDADAGAFFDAALVGLALTSKQTGLEVDAGGVGVLVAGAQTQMRLLTSVTPMPPPRTSSNAHSTGEVYLDDNQDLWLCIADGTPGTWRRLGGTNTAGALTILPTPQRAYDTRPNSGHPGAGTGPVQGTRHDIDLTVAGIPTDATAALVTLTATDTIANPNAYGQIYANALTTPPDTSVINWTTANTIIATTTTTALTNGQVALTILPGANTIIDVLGYHT